MLERTREIKNLTHNIRFWNAKEKMKTIIDLQDLVGRCSFPGRQIKEAERMLDFLEVSLFLAEAILKKDQLVDEYYQKQLTEGTEKSTKTEEIP